MLRKAIEEGKLQVNQRRYSAGTCLYKAGQPAETFFLILQGSVLLTMPNINKNILVQEGQLIGLYDLMKEQHSHTAIIDEDATLIEIPKQELLKAIQSDTQLRLYILQQLSRQSNPTLKAYE